METITGAETGLLRGFRLEMGASILISLTFGVLLGAGCELERSASSALRFSPFAHLLIEKGIAATGRGENVRVRGRRVLKSA